MPESQRPREPDGAAVVLYSGDQVLLHKRDLNPQRFPRRWALFGGGIQPREAPQESALREVREELGLALREGDLELLGRYRVRGVFNDSTVHYFRAELKLSFWELMVSLSQSPGLDLEGEGAALFTHEEVDYLYLRCHDRVALERHFAGPGYGFVD